MLRLADHIYGTVVGEAPILFDVARGRYLLLRGPAAENFRTLWDNESTSGGVAPLIKAGLVHDASTVKFEPGPQSAEVSYEDGLQPFPSRRLTLGAIHAQIVARRALRRQRLPGVLKTLRARSDAVLLGSRDDVAFALHRCEFEGCGIGYLGIGADALLSHAYYLTPRAAQKLLVRRDYS